MIAYHAHDFDVAREHLEIAADTAAEPEIGYAASDARKHLEIAADTAAEPEIGYAAEALRWRFQEEG